MMTKFEELMASHPHLNVEVSSSLPAKLGGLTIGHTIYINYDRGARERYELLQEEIAHYDTSVGNITAEDTLDKRKQEKKARSLAKERAVTLDGLIHCFYTGLWGPEEVADYFGVTEKFLFSALEHYRDKYGVIFRYNGYYFDFRRAINITKIK
ncbi:toxin [Limosilactobacillus fermentum]|nr:toxin [Limosilactobacillus fermentum]